MMPTKAERILEIAIEKGWQGSISGPEQNGDDKTIVAVVRNDESLAVQFVGEEFDLAAYFIFDRPIPLADLKAVGRTIKGWPDVIGMYRMFPNINRVKLTETYRRLPFEFDDDNNEIMAKLLGREVFWYDHTASKIRVDVVMDSKAKSKAFRIVDMGHRKLLHFNGVRDGFKSLLLDSILKVGRDG